MKFVNYFAILLIICFGLFDSVFMRSRTNKVKSKKDDTKDKAKNHKESKTKKKGKFRFEGPSTKNTKNTKKNTDNINSQPLNKY